MRDAGVHHDPGGGEKRPCDPVVTGLEDADRLRASGACGRGFESGERAPDLSRRLLKRGGRSPRVHRVEALGSAGDRFPVAPDVRGEGRRVEGLCPLRDAGERRVHAGEQAVIASHRHARGDEASPGRPGPRTLGAPHVLGPVLAPAPHRQLEVRPAEERVEGARIEIHRGGSAPEAVQLVDLRDAPWLDPELELIREDSRIARHLEGAPGHDPGCLVLPVTIDGCSREGCEDQVGPEGADHPGDVAQQLLLGPVAKRFLGRLRESEVEGAGEELEGSVDRPGRHELSGSYESEPLAQLSSDQILATVPARQREVCCAGSVAPGECREHGGVLVVRVRGDHQDPFSPVELPEEKPRLHDAGLGRLDLGPGRCRRRQREGERP